jgi:hypothetical protein
VVGRLHGKNLTVGITDDSREVAAWTPIKVGDLTVFASADGGYIVARPVGPNDGFPGAVSTEVTLRVGIAYPRTLPMALRVAAEAAGIERQRVEAKHGFWRMQKASGLGMHADFGRFVGVPPSPGLLEIAHRHARERYAALGAVTS